MSLIESSDVPLLLLDTNLKVIAASRSFCRAFQIKPATVSGCPFVKLGAGEWNVPQLACLLEATASGFAEVKDYEFDFKRESCEGRWLVVSAHKLDYYGNVGNIRLLLAVSDVTEAHLAEKHRKDLLREKALLIQELQQRVANSLEIIASVLMQSARKAQSQETRPHLDDAHSRIMSVAAVQQLLAASSINEVELRPYLTALQKHRGVNDPGP